MIGSSFSPVICESCWDKIDGIHSPFCSTCGKPFLSKYGISRTCGNCFERKIYFYQARSCFSYSRGNTISQLILLLKYFNRFSLAETFGEKLSETYNLHYRKHDVDYIVPVPLHFFRRFKRGYNQTELIASSLSKNTKIPVLTKVLVRRKRTPPQQGNMVDRKKNVSGAFTILGKQKITGKTILLVDDVFTTGSTVNECARILRNNGCKRVLVLTIACVGYK